MAEVVEGIKAPSFRLKDKDGVLYNSKEIGAEFLIIYFYPKDNTPGCTTEAVEFSRLLPKFHKLGAQVIGISGGNEKTKQKFCEKHKLKVILLSDPDFRIATKFQTYGEKKFMGKTYMGILRKTFVLDGKGRILKIFPKVKAGGHASEVLEFLGNL